VANAIRRSETIDQVEVFLAGNPANPAKPGDSDLVLALASQLEDMGYTVCYDWRQKTDLDSQMWLAEQIAGCDVFVVTDAGTSAKPDCHLVVVLDDQHGEQRLTIGEFLLVMSTAAVCHRTWRHVW
jgi:hypothetical protein